MKIQPTEYFNIAIPGFLCLLIGMYFVKTRIFTPSIKKLYLDAHFNEPVLKKFVVLGVLFALSGPLFPREFAFFIYLISLIRFVGAFSLFSLNPSKYRYWIAGVLLMELYFGAIAAMYHDALMWILFFGLYYVYVFKPSVTVKLVGLIGCIFFILFIQGLKGAYRLKMRESGNSNLSLIFETSSQVSDGIGKEDNIMESLNRGNQAWIFASTKERMDRIGDYQGLNVLGLYTQSALLPRILAPNKLKSGDKDIFNAFSGHNINENTSMGLGVFADGYIAYGYWGVMFFTFGLGLFFNFTFRIVESWAKLSEFYVLMVLPLLNYAIRPDCELQTTINHLVKGMIVFGILVTLTKFNFVINAGPSKLSQLKRAALPDLNQIHK